MVCTCPHVNMPTGVTAYEVLIARRQSIFGFLQIQAESGLRNKKHKAYIGLCAEARLYLDAQKINKNVLPSGYKHLMGHFNLTTSP